MKLPFIVCLCPTYGRPRLLERSVEMFMAQDYPAERRRLFILDDLGTFDERSWKWRDSGPVEYHWRTSRSPDLPAKFNALARIAFNWIAANVAPSAPSAGLASEPPAAAAVWEDDDEYRPWHLSAHAAALERGEFSKPSRVLSDYGEPPGSLHEEGAAGRFHASIAFTRELYDRIGGWPATKRADFDQQMLSLLAAAARGIGDPCERFPPSYVFRWHTGHYHGQHAMRGPDDEGWYDRLENVACLPGAPGQ